jgi:hypothetical protein
MGLSIHYSGSIKDRSLLPQLGAEMKDICESLGWDYHYFEADEKDPLEGVYFAPEECEPLFLTFTPEGRLLSPISHITREMLVEHGLDPELIYTISTKTQYAGIDAHMAIIRLFRYLSKKYFSHFEMNDEGNYWETDDPEVLKNQFSAYERAIKSFADVLQGLERIPGESPDSLATRIEELLKKMGS